MKLYKVERAELEKIKVCQSPLRALVNNQISESRCHQAIYFGNDLLGVKTLKEDEYMLPLLDYRDVLYALDETCRLLGLGDEGFYLAAKPASWGAMFRGRLHANSYDINDGSNYSNWDLCQSRFTPAVAAVNGYNCNDIIKFYLLAIPEGNIKNGVLTIDKVGLEIESISSFQDNSRKKIEAIRYQVESSIIARFHEKFTEFLQVESDLRKMPGETEEIIAVTLDILNLNRDPQAVGSDPVLEKAIARRIEEIKSHIMLSTNTFQEILTFIASQQNISNFLIPTDPGTYSRIRSTSTYYKRDHIVKLFQEKNAYKRINVRLLSGKNEETSERYKYIGQQVKVMKNLPFDYQQILYNKS